MIDVIIILATISLITTIVVSVSYYTKLKKIQHEYKEAKEIVGNIVTSFNTDLKKENQKISSIYDLTESLVSEKKITHKKFHDYDNQLTEIFTKIDTNTQVGSRSLSELEKLQKTITILKKSQQNIEKQFSTIQQEEDRALTSRESKIKSVIPIKKEKALSSLTKTELNVLEVLVKEDRQTAPEIRAKIELTREHTARLMKTLYEKGYLDRSTERIPYYYRIKEEMKNILKKTSEPK